MYAVCIYIMKCRLCACVDLSFIHENKQQENCNHAFSIKIRYSVPFCTTDARHSDCAHKWNLLVYQTKWCLRYMTFSFE